MQELNLVVERLRNKYNLHAVILFGSRARGDWGPWSDYDILVIADFESPYLKRIGELLELVSDISLPIEFHPYTLNEAVELLRRGCPTIIDALEEGRVLFATQKLKEIINMYEDMKRRGLRRTNTTIILP